MAVTDLHLTDSEVCLAMLNVDVIAVVREALTQDAVGWAEDAAVWADDAVGWAEDPVGWAENAAVWAEPPPAPAHQSGGEGLTLRHDQVSGVTEVLPRHRATAVWRAIVSVTAARHLVSSEVSLAGAVGGGLTARLFLTLVTVALPSLSHIALWGPDREEAVRLAADLATVCRISGVGLSLSHSAVEATLGADLVLVTAGAPIGALNRGAVLIDACGVVIPPEGPVGIVRDSPCPGGQVGAIGLSDVLTAGQAGRAHTDDLVVVVLTTSGAPQLAGHLYRAAVDSQVGHRRTWRP